MINIKYLDIHLAYSNKIDNKKLKFKKYKNKLNCNICYKKH